MKSISLALNNIAISINRLADAVLSVKKTESKTHYSLTPSNTITSNPSYTQAKINYTDYINDVHISSKELEAINSVYYVLTDKVTNPSDPDKMLEKIKDSWPALHKALINLIESKNSKKQNLKTTKDIWTKK